MNIAMKPKARHQFTIRIYLDARVLHELPCILLETQKVKGRENFLLIKTTVILALPGEGEQLLSENSGLDQIRIFKKENKNRFYMPERLIVNISNESNLICDTNKLIGLTSGPLQQPCHKKTISKKRPLWKAIAEKNTEDKNLKNSIETTLFNGERYNGNALCVPQQKRDKKTKRDAKVEHGNSEINEKTEVKGTDRNQEKHSSNTTKKGSKEKDKPFNFEESLAVIKRAAERGEKQFASNLEINE